MTSITNTSTAQRPRRQLSLATMVVVVVLGLRYGVAQEDSAVLESHIPDDVQFALLMNNAADTAMRFQATPIGKMLRSPDWQPYYSLLHEMNSPSLLHIRPWFGVDWADVSEFSVPAAFLIFRDAKSEVAAALLVDSQTDTMAAETLLERSATYFKARGASLVTEVLPNGRRTLYQLPAEFGGSSRPVSLRQHGLLALVSSRNGAEALQHFWNQTRRASLFQLEEYRGAIHGASESLKGEHGIRFWCRPLALAHSIAKKPEDGSRLRQDWLASAERQGFDALRAIGGVLVVSPAECPSLDVAYSIHSRQPYAKACQMASLLPGVWRDPPSFVLDSVASWSLMYQDVSLWFDGFGFLFDEISDPESPGAFRDVLEAVRKDPEGPQIDIEKEIVPRLTPGFVKVHDYEATRTAQNPDGFRALYQLTVRECDPLRAVFKRYFQGDEAVRVSEIGGQVMWSTATGHALLFDTGEEKGVTITSLAVVDGAVLLCTDADWLRSALLNANPDKPLSKSPLFMSAATFLLSHQSEADSLRSFSRVDENWRGPYRQLVEAKSNVMADPRIRLLEWLLCPMSGDRRSEVIARLPAWTSVAPSLGVVAISLRATPVGFEGFLGVLPPTAASPVQAIQSK